MFSLCECCRGFISTAFVGEVKVCSRCFLKLKAIEVRLIEASEQDAQTAKYKANMDAYEVEKLTHWWRMSEGNCVGR